jgi:hypothetical protein
MDSGLALRTPRNDTGVVNGIDAVSRQLAICFIFLRSEPAATNCRTRQW